MKTFLFFALFTFTLSVQAQRNNFVLKNAVPLTNNPAFTGTSEGGRLNYGLTFLNPSHVYYSVNNTLSYDQYVTPLHGGLGVEISYDRWGDIQSNTGASLAYAYQLPIKENFTLSAGFSGKWRRRKTTIPANYPDWESYETSIDFADLTGGVLLYSKQFLVGFQYTHSLTKEHQYYNSKIHFFSTQLGYQFKPFSNENLTISTFANYQNERSYQRLSLTGVFNARYFSLGTSYDFRNDVSVIAALNFKRFQLMYALSLNFNDLAPKNYFASEFVLNVKLPNRPSRLTKSLDMPLY